MYLVQGKITYSHHHMHITEIRISQIAMGDRSSGNMQTPCVIIANILNCDVLGNLAQNCQFYAKAEKTANKSRNCQFPNKFLIFGDNFKFFCSLSWKLQSLSRQTSLISIITPKTHTPK